MWSRLLLLAVLLLPAQALGEVKEMVAALAPSGLVLVMDADGKELVAQNRAISARRSRCGLRISRSIIASSGCDCEGLQVRVMSSNSQPRSRT